MIVFMHIFEVSFECKSKIVSDGSLCFILIMIYEKNENDA